jgi:4-hydroxy-tetrahydrodipicolinate synthase
MVADQRYDQIKSSLRDVAFTTTTPFHDDTRQIHFEALRENVRGLYDAGARCFLPCGNTGEYYSLTNSERVAVVRATVEALPADASVIGGAGGSTGTVRSLIADYEDAGVDAAMVMSPTHTFIHERGLYEHYNQIADSTSLGLLLYKRGPELPDDVISRLTGIENVVGVKYAVKDIDSFSKLQQESAGEAVWVTGIAERFAPAFAFEGAEGFTTGIGNFVPEQSLALFEALRELDWERAKRLRNRLRKYEDLREESGEENSFAAANNVPAVKYGMDLAGFYGGPVRAPLSPLSARDEGRAERYYQSITAEQADELAE